MRFRSDAQRKAVMSKLRFYNYPQTLTPVEKKKLEAKNDYSDISKRELELYTINDGEIYRQRIVPIRNNLEKKYDKGQYNPDKATIGFYHVAEAGAKKYKQEYGSGNFTKAEKLAVAKSIRRSFESELHNR